jgi:DNA-binding CsgD family transcriptional regulator/tetratricopeptide (TPR) repeat protein
LGDGDREALFSAVLDLLQRSLRPTVAVVDDLHWADEATLDLVTYLGRRVGRTSGMLILTFRDEHSSDLPLGAVLGGIPHASVKSVHLKGLSLESTLAMHENATEATRIWEISAGNPFFISELLNGGFSGPIPGSIHDVMRVRMHRLSPRAKNLVKLASVVPGRIEKDLLNAVDPDWSDANDDAVFRGLLEASPEELRFRHEVARRAVEADLTDFERREVNALVLRALEDQAGDLSRCAHHARESGDPDAMLRHVPKAAVVASRMGSHREALAHFRAVEPFIAGMTLLDRAAHYEVWAEEENRGGTGYRQAEQAVALRRDLGDLQALGRSLLLASRMALWDGDTDLSARLAKEAVSILEDSGGDLLAAAYTQLSRLSILFGDAESAVTLAEKALSTAGGPSPSRAEALANLGTLRALQHYPDGIGMLEESAQIAEGLGLTAIRNRALNNISAVAARWRDTRTARNAMERLTQDVDEEEDPATAAHNHLRFASVEFVSGNYQKAVSNLELADDQNLQPRAQTLKALIFAQLEARTGPQSQETALAAARELARTSSEHQFLAQVAAATAERIFVSRSRKAAATKENLEILRRMINVGDPWNTGEPAMWLWLDGHIRSLPDQTPEPILMLAGGQWKESASWFGDRGAPYEQAVALSLGDTAAKLEALSILDQIGAWPLANKIRSELREAGTPGVPRGTIESTRANPLGLTRRQAEVFGLIREGLSNAEIADRLFVSIRTAETHVGAVLAKLGVSSREEVRSLANDIQQEA